MTQFEVKRACPRRANPASVPGTKRYAPTGGIMTLEDGAIAILGLMPVEIRRIKRGSTRAGFVVTHMASGW